MIVTPERPAKFELKAGHTLKLVGGATCTATVDRFDDNNKWLDSTAITAGLIVSRGEYLQDCMITINASSGSVDYVIKDDIFPSEISSLEERPTAAAFGNGDLLIVDTTKPGYRINCTSDGISWDSRGSSNSITDRPSAAALGKGSWQVGLNQYLSDGVNYINASLIPSPYDYGFILNDPSTHLSALADLIASPALFIRFPSGLYHAGFNNRTSNRTFIFEEGAIFDGVIHIANGSGPEGGSSLSVVSNVRAIGTIVSTVRVGSFYCDGVHIDKIRLTGVDAAYTNQTLEGGVAGINFYYGSKNITVNEIDANSTGTLRLAFSCGIGAINDSVHRPDNVNIGTLRVSSSVYGAVSILGCDRFKISKIYVQSYNGGNGITFNDSDVNIGDIYVDGAGTVGAYSNVSVFNNTTANIGHIRSTNAKAWGFIISGSYLSTVNTIESYGNIQDGLKIQSPVNINKALTYNNSQYGIQITSTGALSIINIIESYGNANDGVYLLANVNINKILSHNNTKMGVHLSTGSSLAKISTVESYSNVDSNLYVNGQTDVSINTIITYNSSGASGFGTYLNNTIRFRNKYLSSYGNLQGLRYIGTNTDATFGVIILSSNTTSDLATSGSPTGFFVEKLSYGVLSGSAPNTFVGYQAATTDRKGIFTQTVASGAVSLAVRTDYSTQLFNTVLTADITVTPSTTGSVAGNRFHIIRGAAATGAFNLNIGALKALATAGTWANIEYSGTAWVLTGYGTL